MINYIIRCSLEKRICDCDLKIFKYIHRIAKKRKLSFFYYKILKCSFSYIDWAHWRMMTHQLQYKCHLYVIDTFGIVIYWCILIMTSLGITSKSYVIFFWVIGQCWIISQLGSVKYTSSRVILRETCVVSSLERMLYYVQKPLHKTCVVSSLELMFY